MSHYSRTPLSQVALGLTLAVVISGETTMPNTIVPDVLPHHVAAIGGAWLGFGKEITRQFGVLNAFR